MLKIKTQDGILRNCTQQVFQNGNSTAFQKLFTRFVELFSDRATSSLKGLALVAYSGHPVLLNFSGVFKR